MSADFSPTVQGIDAALAEYESATNPAADCITDLLGLDVSGVGQPALTLRDLRKQVGAQKTLQRRPFAVVTAPRESDALFIHAPSTGARFLVRSAVRLTHGKGLTLRDEIAIGEGACGAIRSGAELSPLADQLARADHVAVYEAAGTLGRPVLVHRDFVVRCAVLGLGEALNAEHEPDLPTSIAVEAWLGQARIRQQRR